MAVESIPASSKARPHARRLVSLLERHLADKAPGGVCESFGVAHLGSQVQRRGEGKPAPVLGVFLGGRTATVATQGRAAHVGEGAGAVGGGWRGVPVAGLEALVSWVGVGSGWWVFWWLGAPS